MIGEWIGEPCTESGSILFPLGLYEFAAMAFLIESSGSTLILNVASGGSIFSLLLLPCFIIDGKVGSGGSIDSMLWVCRKNASGSIVASKSSS